VLRARESRLLRPHRTVGWGTGLQRDHWYIVISKTAKNGGNLKKKLKKSFSHREFDSGNVGWNIAWYINGLLVPEVTVIRGETYTFVVEGGRDPDRPARHHPFYITDDPEGGYEFKTPTERSVSSFLKINVSMDYRNCCYPFFKRGKGKRSCIGIGSCELILKEFTVSPLIEDGLVRSRGRAFSLECGSIATDIQHRQQWVASANGSKIQHIRLMPFLHSALTSVPSSYTVRKGSQLSYNGHPTSPRRTPSTTRYALCFYLKNWLPRFFIFPYFSH